MKVLILKREPIKAKDGKEYVKASAVCADGSIIEVFTGKERFVLVPEDRTVSKEDFTKFFESQETIDVDYDPKGRLIGISL